MNLQQLYYFRTVAELEHFTRASEKLNISQSRLSHAIADMEKELQVSLFVRQGRNVKLTRAGVFLLEHVSQSLDILDRGIEKLADFTNPDTGCVSISYLSSLDSFVTSVVSHFLQESGNTKLRFQFEQTVTTEIEASLMEGSTDLAFTTAFDNKDIEAVKIGSHRTMLIVSAEHPLASCDQADLAMLSEETFVTYGRQCQIRSHIDEIFAAVGITPRIAFEGLSDAIVINLVAANLGVALVSEAVDISGSRVRPIKIVNEIPTRDIYLTWVRDRYMTPAVKKFWNYLVKSGMLLDQFNARAVRCDE